MEFTEWNIKKSGQNLPKIKTEASEHFSCESYQSISYSCEFCNFESNFKVDLFVHTNVLHCKNDEGTCLKNALHEYRCKNCGFHSFSALLLTKHVFDRCLADARKPLTQKLKCHYCPYEIRTVYRYRQHMYRKHVLPLDEKWYECDQCPHRTNRKDNLRMHKIWKHSASETIRWYYCDQCPHKAKYNYMLQRHIRNRHRKIPPAEVKWFECDQCPYKSKTRAGVRRHVSNRHVDPGKLGAAVLQVPVKWFDCDKCSHRTKYKHKLEAHKVNIHYDGSREIRWFECDRCSFKTKQNTHLKEHVIAKHMPPNEIRWFECEYCSFRSKTKARLMRHVKKMKHVT